MTLLTCPAFALLLRTTLLLGLALLAVRLLHRRGPAVQTLAGRAALSATALLLLTAPLTKFVPPLWHVPAAPRPAATVPAPTVALTAPPTQSWGARDLPQPLLQRGERGASPAPTAFASDPPVREDPAKQGDRSLILPSGGGVGGGLLLLWVTGTALLLLWLAACQTHLTWLHRRAVPLTNGPVYDTLATLTPAPSRLFVCPGSDGPFLAGIVRPTIYLPADHAETFSPDALHAVLAHELAHANRHDTRWTLASRLLCALLWPQPLVWLLCRRLEQLSEDACDRAVLAQNCPPRVYADCLLSLAERRPLPRSQRTLVQGLVPFRSQLARRIQHILAAKGNLPMPIITTRLRLAIAAATLATALSGTLFISAAPAQVASPTSVSTPTLIGIWSGKSDPGAKIDILIFGPHGESASVDQDGSYYQYGHYAFHGATLTVSQTGPIYNHQHKVVGHSQVEGLSLSFSITGNILTLQRKGLSATVARRISDYPTGLAIEAVVAQQGALTGAKPPVAVLNGFADPTQIAPPATTNMPPLVGIWSGKPNSTSRQSSTIVFSPQGEIASVDKAGSQFEYGHYKIDGATLTVKTAGPIFDSHHKQIGYTQNAVITMAYSIAKGILTLKRTDAPVMTAHRVSDYPEGLAIEDVAAKQGGLMGAEPSVADKTSLSEAQLLAGLTPVQRPKIVVTLTTTEQKEKREALHQVLNKCSKKLKTHSQSSARYYAQLREQVRMALPDGDSQTLAKAISLERSIGGFNLSLNTIIEIGKQHPEHKDTEQLVLTRQREMKPLLAEERHLFPATPQMQ